MQVEDRIMKYTEKLLKHPEFLRIMKRVKTLEQNRIYCHHELEHSLDVARLAWITYLEERTYRNICNLEAGTYRNICNFGERTYENICVSEERIYRKMYDLEQTKDLIYACALLHDIGRAAQYESGVHHSVSGLSLAEQIMTDCDVPLVWRQQILNVISEHHQSLSGKEQEEKICEESRKTERLEYYIRKADHDCRLCFFCEAKETCKWKDAERNETVIS